MQRHSQFKVWANSSEKEKRRKKLMMNSKLKIYRIFMRVRRLKISKVLPVISLISLIGVQVESITPWLLSTTLTNTQVY